MEIPMEVKTTARTIANPLKNLIPQIPLRDTCGQSSLRVLRLVKGRAPCQLSGKLTRSLACCVAG